jgi:hypothetical protein
VVYDMGIVKQLETNATQKTTTKEKKKLWQKMNLN